MESGIVDPSTAIAKGLRRAIPNPSFKANSTPLFNHQLWYQSSSILREAQEVT
ncbi:MAG: hypothetical protein QXQ39_07305 [Conexivisphaerales archaeon]